MTLKISDYEIENARKVIDSHTVNPLTKEGALESLIFCIASQAWKWEKASDFIHALRKRETSSEGYASLSTLKDKDYVNSVAKQRGWRFHHENRFDSSIDFFDSANNLNEIVQAEDSTREKYCNQINFVGYKTFSFWHICLGGKNLLALDVHVMRGLNKMGILMDNYFFESKPRIKGDQSVRRTPSEKDYSKIEGLAKDLFSEDERFVDQNGNVDMALVDGVLWWKGANRNGNQIPLSGEFSEWNYIPYSKLNGN